MSFTITIIYLNTTDVISLDTDMRNFQRSWSGLVYIVYIGLLSTDFVFHLVVRFTLTATVTSIGVFASSLNAETEPVRSAILHLAGMITIELIFYV